MSPGEFEPRTEEDVIGKGRAVSFLEALTRAQPWADRAACKGSGLLFLVEPSAGLENPRTVVRCFELCAACPVRAECLRDALSARFTAYGVWGATTMTERRPLTPGRTTEIERSQALDADERVTIEEAAQLLERTFEERLRTWRRLAEEAHAP